MGNKNKRQREALPLLASAAPRTLVMPSKAAYDAG